MEAKKEYHKEPCCCFAPMEGITGYVYRNAHHALFPHVDLYVTPFLQPNQNHRFSSRERNDILPEHNKGITLIPQILTNRAEDFIWMVWRIPVTAFFRRADASGCWKSCVTVVWEPTVDWR